MEKFTGLKEVRPQISIVLHDKHLLFFRMSPLPWPFQLGWSTLWCKRRFLIVILVTSCLDIRHEIIHFLTVSLKWAVLKQRNSIINYQTTFVLVHECCSTDDFLLFAIFKLKIEGAEITHLFVSTLMRILLLIRRILLQCIYQPSNTVNNIQQNTFHTVQFIKYETPTCFGRGVPSSGSLLEQRNTIPTRWSR